MVSLWGRPVAGRGVAWLRGVAGPSDVDRAGLLMLRGGATARGVAGGVGDVDIGGCRAVVEASSVSSAGGSSAGGQGERLKKLLFRVTCVSPRLAVIIDPFLPTTTKGSSW